MSLVSAAESINSAASAVKHLELLNDALAAITLNVRFLSIMSQRQTQDFVLFIAARTFIYIME